MRRDRIIKSIWDKERSYLRTGQDNKERQDDKKCLELGQTRETESD